MLLDQETGNLENLKSELLYRRRAEGSAQLDYSILEDGRPQVYMDARRSAEEYIVCEATYDPEKRFMIPNIYPFGSYF